MKKTILLKALALLTLALFSTLAVGWWWQATRAEHLVMLPIPEWLSPKDAGARIEGDVGIMVEYSIAIGRSQVKPWGTVWRGESRLRLTEGKWKFFAQGNVPQLTTAEVESYLHRFRALRGLE